MASDSSSSLALLRIFSACQVARKNRTSTCYYIYQDEHKLNVDLAPHQENFRGNKGTGSRVPCLSNHESFTDDAEIKWGSTYEPESTELLNETTGVTCDY